MTRFRALLNPKNPAGHYVLPHAVVLLLLVAISLFVGFGAGWFAGTRYTQDYFASHYRAPLAVVTARYHVAIPRRAASLPPKASIQTALLPAVSDQGDTGSCAAQSSIYYDLSYAWRRAHPGSYLRFSPRMGYDAYSIKYSNGQDAGSWPTQDIEISNTTGIPRFKAFPYGSNSLGLPAYGIDNPIPQFALSAAIRFPSSDQSLTYGMGGGQGLVDSIKAQIAQGNPVSIAIPVQSTFDNATFDPYIVPASDGSNRGGHEITLVSYNDTTSAHGTTGFFKLRNSWSTGWGKRGDAFLSYSYVANLAFGADVVTIGTTAKAVRHGQPNPAPTFGPPAKTSKPSGGQRGYWAKHAPYTSIVNAAGNHWKVWPLGILATIGTESNFQPNVERWGVYPDWSCGLMQESIPTAQSYGVAGDARTICNWEKNPVNAIWLGARILHDYRDICGWRFSRLYACYNEGAFRGHYDYLTPIGGGYFNWLGWQSYVLAHYQ